MGPTQASERILYVDMLRGMALFGIITANMRGFNAPESVYGEIRFLFHGRADIIAQAFIDTFIQGKFVTLFSFLFGLGFAIQMTRAEERGARFMGFYPRRLAALALFGLIHGLAIWWGDILLMYAVTGAILLLFRKTTQKTVLIWIGCLMLAPILVMSGVYIATLASHQAIPFGPVPTMDKVQNAINIYSHGSVAAIYKENWVQWKGSLFGMFFTIWALALFLMGLYVWRSGIVTRLSDYGDLMKRVCRVCLPLGIVLNAVVTILGLTQPLPDANTKMTFVTWITSLLGFFSPLVLSAGYASGLALLIRSDAWKRRLTPFAAVGRMALTNYLMQSVICTFFYYSYTTGLYGRVGPAMGLIPTFIIYGAQIPFSVWWLKQFRFGPMEWLWRGMTYGKLPAFRKAVAPEGEWQAAVGG